jgi:hypothetical protein
MVMAMTRLRTLIAAAFASTIGLAGLALAAGPDEGAKPAMADLMAMTQLRHFKLWYASRVENWALADYELRQMRGVLSRIARLYPEEAAKADAVRFGEETGPILEGLQAAIGDHDQKRFATQFGKLTDACNQCHRGTGVSFIAVQVPNRSPFSNQNFRPQTP